MPITLTFLPKDENSSENQKKFFENILKIMSKFWEPYVNCPWKKKVFYEYDNIIPGSVTIHLPFITLIEFFDEDDTLLQIGKLIKLMKENRIDNYELKNSKNIEDEKNPSSLSHFGSYQRGYIYPRNYLEDGNGIFSTLPIEILQRISFFLRASNFFLISHTFADIARLPDFWNYLLLQDFSNIISSSDLKSYNLKPYADRRLKEIFIKLTYLNNYLSNPSSQYDQSRFIGYNHWINRLILEKTNPEDSPWLYFIKGILYAYELIRASIDRFDQAESITSMASDPIMIAHKNFKLSLENKHLFPISLSMHAFTHPHHFDFYEKKYMPDFKPEFIIDFEKSFRLTHDPVAAFDIGAYYHFLSKNAAELQDLYLRKSILWFRKSLKYGLENYGQLPSASLPRKDFAFKFIALAGECPLGSQALFNFYERNKAYVVIFIEWQNFQQNRVVESGPKGRKIFLNKIIDKMGEAKSLNEAYGYAQGLFDYLMLRSECDPLAKIAATDWLTPIEIKSLSEKTRGIVDKVKGKTGKFGFNQYRLLGHKIYMNKECGINQADIEKELKGLIEKQKNTKNPITWTTETIEDQACAKMTCPIKEMDKTWFEENLSFPISFVKEKDHFYLIIHGINEASFKKAQESKLNFNF